MNPRIECAQEVTLLLEVSPVPYIPIFVLVKISPLGPNPGDAQVPKSRNDRINKRKWRFLNCDKSNNLYIPMICLCFCFIWMHLPSKSICLKRVFFTGAGSFGWLPVNFFRMRSVSSVQKSGAILFANASK